MSRKQSPLEIPELLDLCIGYLASSQGDLLSCALVARRWTGAAQFNLFSAPMDTVTGMDLFQRDIDSYDRILRQLYDALAESPHLVRYVRELQLGDRTATSTIKKLCSIPFTHLESLTLMMRRLKNYGTALKSLLGLRTLRYVSLNLDISFTRCVAHVLPHLSSSIEHLDVCYDQRLPLKPMDALGEGVPMRLKSLGLTVIVKTITQTPQTLRSLGFYPFDISGLKAVAVSCLSPIQWDTIPTHTLQVLDIDPMDEETPLDLSLFPALRNFRIKISPGLPPMVPATVAKVSQCQQLHTMAFVFWGNDLSDADCALFDSVIATSGLDVVQFQTRARQDETVTLSADRFPRSMARNMLQVVADNREIDRWWQDRVLEL
ncbi:hypothetical protein R3P38DRAFT_3272190 [Favolaschia claudopus]|uniref:F-box domain-containing protein n=1 Tax=Favolaschia claudopus TaxID=2862362 RepID=A0AAW0B3P8_9AGAR